jgi:hypothetical protein
MDSELCSEVPGVLTEEEASELSGYVIKVISSPVSNYSSQPSGEDSFEQPKCSPVSENSSGHSRAKSFDSKPTETNGIKYTYIMSNWVLDPRSGELYRWDPQAIYVRTPDRKIRLLFETMKEEPGRSFMSAVREELAYLEQICKDIRNQLSSCRGDAIISETRETPISTFTSSVLLGDLRFGTRSYREGHLLCPEIHLLKYLPSQKWLQVDVVQRGLWQRMLLLTLWYDDLNLERAAKNLKPLLKVPERTIWVDPALEWCGRWFEKNPRWDYILRWRINDWPDKGDQLMKLIADWLRGVEFQFHNDEVHICFVNIIAETWGSLIWGGVKPSKRHRSLSVVPNYMDQGRCWLKVIKEAHIYQLDSTESNAKLLAAIDCKQECGNGPGLVLPLHLMLFAAGAFGGNVYGNQLVIFGQNWNVVTEATSNFLDWHVLLHEERLRHTPVDFLVDSIAVMKRFDELVVKCKTDPVFVTLGWLDGYSWTPIEQTKMTTDTSDTKKLRWITELTPKVAVGLSSMAKTVVNAAGSLEATARHAWREVPQQGTYERQLIAALLKTQVILVDTNAKTAHVMSRLRCALMLAFNEIENLGPWWQQLEQECISRSASMNWTLPSDETDSAAALASALELLGRNPEDPLAPVGELLKEHLALCCARLFPLGGLFTRQHHRMKGFHWNDICGRHERVHACHIPLRGQWRCWPSISGLGGIPCIFAYLGNEAIQIADDGRFRVSGRYWMTAFVEDVYEQRHLLIPQELCSGLVHFPCHCKATIVRARDHIPSTTDRGSVWDIVQSHVHDSAIAVRIAYMLTHLRNKSEPETSVVRNGLTVFN